MQRWGMTAVARRRSVVVGGSHATFAFSCKKRAGVEKPKLSQLPTFPSSSKTFPSGRSPRGGKKLDSLPHFCGWAGRSERRGQQFSPHLFPQERKKKRKLPPSVSLKISRTNDRPGPPSTTATPTTHELAYPRFLKSGRQ